MGIKKPKPNVTEKGVSVLPPTMGGFKKTAEEDVCTPPSNFDRVLPVLDLHVFVYYYTMTLRRCPPTMGGFKKTAEEDVRALPSNFVFVYYCTYTVTLGGT